jgi:hypothetical protein
MSVSDKAVVVLLFNPLVDDRARPGSAHIRAEDGSLIRKVPGRHGVAASFGEEDGDGVVGGILLKLVVARDTVGRVWSTPLICVEGVEVQTFRCFGPTDEVILEHRTELSNVGRRVANRDFAVVL